MPGRERRARPRAQAQKTRTAVVSATRMKCPERCAKPPGHGRDRGIRRFTPPKPVQRREHYERRWFILPIPAFVAIEITSLAM